MFALAPIAGGKVAVGRKIARALEQASARKLLVWATPESSVAILLVDKNSLPLIASINHVINKGVLRYFR